MTFVLLIIVSVNKSNQFPPWKVSLVKTITEEIIDDKFDLESGSPFFNKIHLSFTFYQNVIKRLTIYLSFLPVADISYFPYCLVLVVALLLWDEILFLVR